MLGVLGLFGTILVNLSSSYGFNLTTKQRAALEQFYGLLIETNRKFNLTAIVEPEEFVLKHFIDSFMVNSKVNIGKGLKVLDVGAGAGFPSVPIAILRPDLKFTQIDCLNKRVVFLKQVASLLKLNVEVFHGRAEEFGKNRAFRECFDFVVARAVAPLNRLLEYCLPFVKVGGMFVALKGKNFESEIKNSKNAVRELGGKIEEIKTFKLGLNLERALILIRKISQTATKYPRINSKILKCAL